MTPSPFELGRRVGIAENRYNVNQSFGIIFTLFAGISVIEAITYDSAYLVRAGIDGAIAGASFFFAHRRRRELTDLYKQVETVGAHTT